MNDRQAPLAARLRPTNLDDFIGQPHLTGENGFVRQLVSSGKLASLILWGPPGSGKTTLGRIIANETSADFIEISAVTAKLQDVRKIVERAKRNAGNLDLHRESDDQQTKLYEQETGKHRTQPYTKNSGAIKTVLFVDEIHRFNKAQQDAFLPHVETGLITLIGATTENPGFEVNRPLLSRCQVLVLEPLGREDILAIIKRGAKHLRITSKLSDKARDYLAELSGGDGRTALNILEISTGIAGKKITPETIEAAAQKRVPGFDKQGDMHHDLISAFIKSLRGSDTDAALYFLARMVEAGEDPKFIARRMVIFASEDIGIATNGALNVAVATFHAVEQIGMPEAKYNLFHCASLLARCQKSRQVTDAMIKATDLAKRHPDAPVPLRIRNAPTKLSRDLGHGKGYEWQAGFRPEDGFLPEEIKNASIWPEEDG